MTKDLIKYLISDYQKQVVAVNIIPRDVVFEDSLNYVLVGLRRAGKSYLLYQQIQHLLAQGHSVEEILYFNFEDDRIESVSTTDLDLIKTSYEEMYARQPIFFLDEVQLVEKWEKFARRLADRKYRVYITGSNAKMLSSEIATTLGGRYMVQEVYPFSFKEYLRAVGIRTATDNLLYTQRKEIEKAYNTYFRQGGLPELTQVQNKRSWLSNLFNKIFFGDLISRFQIRNDLALRVLVRKLAECVGQPASYTRLTNIVSSVGKKISVDTVIDYIRYMSDSWLILSFENICATLADKESNKKYYFIDNGILNLFLIDPYTALLENQVAVRLYQLYGDRVYYYQKNIEVDFFVYDIGLALQVSYSIQDHDTRERETNALIKLSNHLNVTDMLIITKDEEEVLEVNGKTIHVLPIWKWMMQPEEKKTF